MPENQSTEAPYIMNVKVDGQPVIDEALGNLIGETVCVSYTTTLSDNGMFGHRRNFEPQISVQAKLEGSKETGRYRVLVNDSTYSYFYNDSVSSMGQQVGKRAVIFLS